MHGPVRDGAADGARLDPGSFSWLNVHVDFPLIHQTEIDPDNRWETIQSYDSIAITSPYHHHSSRDGNEQDAGELERQRERESSGAGVYLETNGEVDPG